MKRIATSIRGRSNGDWYHSYHYQKLEVLGKKSSTITSVYKDNMILEIFEK